MNSSSDVTPKDKGTVLAEERTELAFHRSVFAAERTLMAWVRTAISMIGFGFTIYKFFQYLPEELVARKVAHPNAARNLGATLVALGTVALAAAAWQHIRFLKQIGVPLKQGVKSISFVVSIVVVLIGVLTFFGVLLKHGPY